MDTLTPPILTAVRELRWHLSSGFSLKLSVQRYLARSTDEFARTLREMWILFEQGGPVECRLPGRPAFTKTFWSLLERGARGEPVLEAMTALEADLESAALQDVEDHLSYLPFKALFPLLLFQFPAFGLVLLGPILRELQRHLLVALLLLMALPARASTSLSEAVTKRIDQAKSADEIRKVSTVFNEISLRRRACAIELKERRVPYMCFAALDLEQRWKLVRDSKGTTDRLDERCREAAYGFRGVEAGDVKKLSGKCRADVLKARAVMIYRSRDHWRDR